MRRAKDIYDDYFRADKGTRFDYLYDHYSNRAGVLNAQKHGLIYLVECSKMRTDWKEYCKDYNSTNRNETIARIEKCMERGEAFDFEEEGFVLPQGFMEMYKNYCLMKVEFQIFSETLQSIGGEDEELLRRYIKDEISLWDIAEERHTAYETAKGKVRDLKKMLKERTIGFFTDEMVDGVIS